MLQKRRERINERLRILQSLVPNGTKVLKYTNRGSMLCVLAHPGRTCSAMDDSDFISVMNGGTTEIRSAEMKFKPSIAEHGQSEWGQHAPRVQ